MTPVIIKPNSSSTRYVALDNSNKVIAEAITAQKVVDKARKLGVDFSILYVPKRGTKCFY